MQNVRTKEGAYESSLCTSYSPPGGSVVCHESAADKVSILTPTLTSSMSLGKFINSWVSVSSPLESMLLIYLLVKMKWHNKSSLAYSGAKQALNNTYIWCPFVLSTCCYCCYRLKVKTAWCAVYPDACPADEPGPDPQERLTGQHTSLKSSPDIPLLPSYPPALTHLIGILRLPSYVLQRTKSELLHGSYREADIYKIQERSNRNKTQSLRRSSMPCHLQLSGCMPGSQEYPGRTCKMRYGSTINTSEVASI